MKYSLVSKKASKDNFIGISLRRIESDEDFCGWLILASVEDENFSFSEDLIPIDNDWLLQKINGFDKIIFASEIGDVYVHNTGFDQLIKIDKTEMQTISGDAFATNQGHVEVSFLQWRKYNKQPLTNQYLLILFFLILIPLLKFISVIAIIIFWREIRQYKIKIKEHYLVGNVVSGIVVQTNPVLIAYNTDLTKGFGSYPVVKIEAFPTFKTYHKGKVEKGSRIPMVAIYYQFAGPNLNYWNDFSAFPVEFATKDSNIIGKKYYSISEEDWQYAENALVQVNIKKCALTAIDVDTSSWKNEMVIKEGRKLGK